MVEYTIFDNYMNATKEDEVAEALFEECGKEEGWESPDHVPIEWVLDEIKNQKNKEWESVEKSLKEFFSGDYFIFYGTFGMWYGDLVVSKIFKSYHDLKRIWKDYDFIHLYDLDGHFYIQCSTYGAAVDFFDCNNSTDYDGDGHNFFEIKRLTKIGLEYLKGENLFNQEAHKRAFDCELYTALPYYAEKMLGSKQKNTELV